MDMRYLTHEELLQPGEHVKKYGLTTGVLGPGSIPVHPLVYRSDFAYSSEFLAHVLSNVPQGIGRDLDAIERILGRKPSHTMDQLLDTRIVGRNNPNRKSIDVVGGVSSNIAIEPGSHIETIRRDLSGLPYLSAGRAALFSLNPERTEIACWYTHTPFTNGFGVFLQLRNFAILFNNLGIDRLK